MEETQSTIVRGNVVVRKGDVRQNNLLGNKNSLLGEHCRNLKNVRIANMSKGHT